MLAVVTPIVVSLSPAVVFNVVKEPAAAVVLPTAGGAAKMLLTNASVASFMLVSPAVCVVVVVPLGIANALLNVGVPVKEGFPLRVGLPVNVPLNAALLIVVAAKVVAFTVVKVGLEWLTPESIRSPALLKDAKLPLVGRPLLDNI
jgi:hypothetical protein